MRKQTRRKVLVFILGLIGLLFILAAPGHTYADGPGVINFQGKVVNSDGTNVANGTYNFNFVLYDSPSLGSPSDGVHDKWHELNKSIQVTNGVFQTELGSATPLPDFNTNPTLYLAIQFNNDAQGYMTPRIHLDSTPYALNADKLGGISASGFIQNGTGLQANSNFDISGTGIANLFQAPAFDSAVSAGALGIGTTNAGVVTLGNAANSSILFKTKASTTAFQVQGTSSVDTLLVDTADARVGIGPVNSLVATLEVQADPSHNTTVRLDSAASGTTVGFIQADNTGLSIEDRLGNLLISSAGSGTISSTTSTIIKPLGDSATSFQIQNSNSKALLTADSSAGKILLGMIGASGINGQLVFNSATANGYNVGLAVSSSQTASYSLKLPTGGPSTSQCLQTSGSDASQLAFGACGSGGGGTLSSTYSTTTPSSNTITVAQNGGGVVIQDAPSAISGSLLTVQNNGGGTKYLDVSSAGVSMQGTNDVATLGPELIQSQDFTNPTYWTCTGWTTTTTTAQHNTGNTSTCSATTSNLTIVGGGTNTYQISYQLAGNTTATETVTAGVGGAITSSIGQSGTHTQVLVTGTIGNGTLIFTPTSNFNGTISAVSVKKITISSSDLTLNNSNGSTGVEVRSGGSTQYNTYIGLSAGRSTTTGQLNAALGTYALQSDTTGQSNSAFGDSALLSNTTGGSNTAVGASALLYNTSGSSNAAFGQQALIDNTTGSANTAIGASSLTKNTTGLNNVGVGVNSLYSNITGSNDTAIGAWTGIQDPYVSGFATPSGIFEATMIGYGAQAQAGNVLILGGQGINMPNVGIGTTVPTNLFSISPDFYDTGTAYQDNGTAGVAGTTVHGVGTSWTADMVGMEFIFGNTDSQSVFKETITSVTNSTTLTVNISQLDGSSGSPVVYRIHNPAFYVTRTGQTRVRTSTDSTTAFQVQDASGSGVFTVDTVNNQVAMQGANSNAVLGPELVQSQDFTNPTYWTCTGWTTTTTSATHNTGNTGTCVATAANINYVSGKMYQISYTLSGNTDATNTVSVSIGSGAWAGIGQTGSNTQTYVTNTVTTSNLTMSPTTNFNGTISNVSVKVVTPASSVVSINNSDGTAGIELRSGGNNTSNTFIGLQAGQANTSVGTYNTALGASALSFNTSGTDNTALGNESLQYNTTGTYNTGVGDSTLIANTTGNYNNATGYGALYNNTSGSQNSASGFGALSSSTTGDNNTAFGAFSQANNITGSNNTSIGYNSGFQDVDGFSTSTNLQNATMIGYDAQAQASNVLILGSAGSEAVNVGIGTTAPGNLFSVSPEIYNTGTASTSASSTVVGSGTSWTSDMVGMEFIFANGSKYTITGFTDATHMTLSSSSTNSSQAYRIHNTAFYVSGTGQTEIRTSTNSATAFQVQNASGVAILNIDTAGGTITVTGSLTVNGSISATGNVFGAFHGFRAYLTGSQSIPSSTWTKINLDTESYDTNNEFDSVTNHRFQPSVAGYYSCSAQLGIDNINGSAADAALYMNGSVDAVSTVSVTGLNTFIQGVSDVVHMNGTSDYMELWGYQNRGSSLAIMTGANTHFSCYKLGN